MYLSNIFTIYKKYSFEDNVISEDRHSLCTVRRAEIRNDNIGIHVPIDIHQAAQIGEGVMLDHGHGVVIGATAVVTDCHTPAERSKAQGMNDFFVFAATAAVSFLAGSILHSSGWQAVNWMIFPALALILVPLLWQAAREPVRPSPG